MGAAPAGRAGRPDAGKARPGAPDTGPDKGGPDKGQGNANDAGAARARASRARASRFADSEFAPAKVNLALHVTGRRADGYHELDSLVIFADAGDYVRLARAGAPSLNGPALKISGPHGKALKKSCLPAHNLVMRAAHGFARHFGIAAVPPLHLDKVLPVAAGLGGGTSDGAAALRLLHRNCLKKECNVPGARLEGDGAHGALAEIVAGLGADGPACLAARPCRMRGSGAHLCDVGLLPPFALLLVTPECHLETRSVFAGIAPPFGGPLPEPPATGFQDVMTLAAYLRHTRNDLMKPAMRRCPGIAPVMQMLRRLDGVLYCTMSGSGPTCLALFADAAKARAAAACVPLAMAGFGAGSGAGSGALWKMVARPFGAVHQDGK